MFFLFFFFQSHFFRLFLLVRLLACLLGKTRSVVEDFEEEEKETIEPVFGACVRLAHCAIADVCR